MVSVSVLLCAALAAAAAANSTTSTAPSYEKFEPNYLIDRYSSNVVL